MVSKVEGIMMCSAGPSQETPLVEGSWGVTIEHARTSKRRRAWLRSHGWP